MNINFYAYNGKLNKAYQEGLADASARLRAKEDDKFYYGDELVTKIRRHDGSYIYQLRDCVFEELLKYIGIMNEAAETVYSWKNISGTPKELTTKQKMFMYFVDGVKPERKYIESMMSCYKGSPMLDFFRNPEEVKKAADVEKVKLDITALWGY